MAVASPTAAFLGPGWAEVGGLCFCYVRPRPFLLGSLNVCARTCVRVRVCAPTCQHRHAFPRRYVRSLTSQTLLRQAAVGTFDSVCLVPLVLGSRPIPGTGPDGCGSWGARLGPLFLSRAVSGKEERAGGLPSPRSASPCDYSRGSILKHQKGEFITVVPISHAKCVYMLTAFLRDNYLITSALIFSAPSTAAGFKNHG